MATHIIDRGRGPEIEGTRVTVYRVLDFVREGGTAKRIAAELELTEDQVESALAYIAAHRQDIDREYANILERVNQPNPPWVEVGGATAAADLKKRILDRASRDLTHADSCRQ